MKYPSRNTSDLFCEQVNSVTNLFEKWNQCERTVVMYALLKRLKYPNLKFLLNSIESTLQQHTNNSSSSSTTTTNNSKNINNNNNSTNNNTNSSNAMTMADLNANDPKYLNNLLISYNTTQICVVPDKDSINCGSSEYLLQSIGSGSTLCGFSLGSGTTETTLHSAAQNNKNCLRKEEILSDVMGLLPMLKPGNDDAKKIYLALIPTAVEDSVKSYVPTELVQQIFSYLLIHPAITNEDRRSLSHYLRYLEEHINSSFSHNNNNNSTNNNNNNNNNNNQFNIFQLPNNNQTTTSLSDGLINPLNSSLKSISSTTASSLSVGSMTTTSSSLSALSTSTSSWQKTIAPPSQSLNKLVSGVAPDCWGVGRLCDEFQSINKFNDLGLTYPTSSSSSSSASSSSSSSSSCNNQDDHHVSFSKNGTEIIDYDSGDGGSVCNNPALTPPPPVGTCSTTANHMSSTSAAQFGLNLLDVCDQFNLPTWNPPTAALKTRRSNSLTTSALTVQAHNAINAQSDHFSISTENLALYAQKPRSFSLSIENTRGPSGLTSTGSDPDLKPNYLKFSTPNVGMSNIGQWLKSLRLHKYIGHFANMTYDEMMNITEDYLQSLNVTKGASHKLALCIEKLKERYVTLVQLEQDFIAGKIQLNTVLEELANIVLTPMKPANDSSPNNVARKFLCVLEMGYKSVMQKDWPVPMEHLNDCVTLMIYILDKAIQCDAFLQYVNQLKDQRFTLAKSYAAKMHHNSGKNGSNGNLNKPRWNNKSRKPESLIKTGSSDRIHRKNSNDVITFTTAEQDKFYQMHHSSKNSMHHHHQPQQYKSSSYPNFNQQSQQQQMQHHNSKNLVQLDQHHSQTHSQQQQQPKYNRNHRHSLNNLIVVSSHPQQPSQIILNPNNAVLSNNQQQQQSCSNAQQPQNRRQSLTVLSNATGLAKTNSEALPAATSTATTSLSAPQQQQQPQTSQQPQNLLTNTTSSKPLEKTMAAVVLVNSNNSNTTPTTNSNNNNNNNNNNTTNNNNNSSSNNNSNNSSNKSKCSSKCGNKNGVGKSQPQVGSGDSVGVCGISSGNADDNKTSFPVKLSASQSNLSDIKSLEQLEFLCMQMTEQAIN